MTRSLPGGAEPSDIDLMLAVRGGDLGQLGTLFERHHGAVYRLCFHLTRDAAASEDLTQEVFMRVLKYRRSYRPEGRFSAWLHAMARNACRDHLRSHLRRGEVSDSTETEPVSSEPSALRALAARRDAASLVRALDELPREQRELLVLSRFERRRYAEIAERLGCSVGAVKVRVHRAVKRLREIYLAASREAAL